jgi:autotransporter-associated beta strand protein
VANLNVTTGTGVTTLSGGNYYYDYSVFNNAVNLTGNSIFQSSNQWVRGVTFKGDVTGTSKTLTASLGNGAAGTEGSGTSGLIFNTNSTQLVSVNIAGNSGPTKTGTGITTLSGTNTYTGLTTVSAGTLSVTGSLSGTQVSVSTGGTFAGTGTVNTNNKLFTLASGAQLDPGTNGTTGLTVSTGSANFDISGVSGTNKSELLFNLDTTSNSDKLTLSSGTLTIGTNALDFGDFAFTTTAGFGPGTYTLIHTNAAINGSLATSGLTGTLAGWNATLSISGNQDVLLTVVPEPGAWVSLLGGCGVLLGLRRRRH